VAEDLLTTNLYRHGSRRTLFVAGELDVATAPLLQGAVDGALDGHGGEFWLDLSDLTFMDSTGARAIAHAHDRAASLGGRLVVLSPTPAVCRVLNLMGLDQVMDIRDGASPPRNTASTA
jgi:anti-anti-sigma factor